MTETSRMAAPHIFDEGAAARRMARAYAIGAETFLIERAGEDLRERLAPILRSFRIAADLGTPTGHFADVVHGRAGLETLVRIVPAGASSETRQGLTVIGDPAQSPLAPETFDLIVSGMALHSINDLPGALIQIRRALRPDGLFLACLPGGQTLMELRTACRRPKARSATVCRRASSPSSIFAISAACCSAPASRSRSSTRNS